MKPPRPPHIEAVPPAGGERAPLATGPDTVQLEFQDHRLFHDLLGRQDEHVKVIERALHVRIGVAGKSVSISGDQVDRELAGRVLTQLYSVLERGFPVYASDVDYALRILASDHTANVRDIFLDTIYIAAQKRVITPKSVVQKAYIDSIRHHDIVFAIGPAGTGKTYLAMAMGVAAVLKQEFTRIILTRPAVEAGEKLGFLPGDLAEKVNPYLRPLYDALHDMVDFDRARKMLDRGTIEVAPLAFMRGRTLNDSFIILDEAQNTSPEQMQMFLTRLGFGSKVVVTGDVTQIDLPRESRSGLVHVREVLKEIEGISFIEFGHRDVVRHKLVQRIVEAYKEHTDERNRT